MVFEADAGGMGAWRGEQGYLERAQEMMMEPALGGLKWLCWVFVVCHSEQQEMHKKPKLSNTMAA